MNKIILLLFTLLPLTGACKKLKITQCVLANGTVSFQEESCSNPKTKIVPSPKVNAVIKSSKKTIRVPLSDQKFPDISVDNNLIKTISNHVRGFNISIDVLNRWSVINRVYNNKLLHMKFLDDKPGTEISLLIDFIFPDNKNFSSPELTDIIHLSSSRFIKGSIEGQVNVYKLNISNGKGVMASFTHPYGINDYKHLSKGVVFKNHWLVQFTLLSNSKHSQAYEYALHALFNRIVIQN